MFRTVHEAPGLLDRTHDGGELIENNRFAFLMMLGFVIMLFAGLIGAYLVLRGGSLTWPPPEVPKMSMTLPLISVGIFALATACLWIARRLSKPGSESKAFVGLLLAVVLFIFSMGVAANEWIWLFDNGMILKTVFGGIYSVLVGAFMLHVIVALCFIISLDRPAKLLKARSRRKMLNLGYFVTTLTVIWYAVVFVLYH